MTRSAVPGYLASAAALAFVAAAPVAGVPNPGGEACVPDWALEVAAAGTAVVVVVAVVEEPQPVSAPPSATGATGPAIALRRRRRRWVCVIDMPPSSARRGSRLGRSREVAESL